MPIKFNIFAGDVEKTSVNDIESLTVEHTANRAPDGATTESNLSPRYDTSEGQFIANWKVPKGAAQCYEVTLTANDDNGSTLSAKFRTK